MRIVKASGAHDFEDSNIALVGGSKSHSLPERSVTLARSSSCIILGAPVVWKSSLSCVGGYG